MASMDIRDNYSHQKLFLCTWVCECCFQTDLKRTFEALKNFSLYCALALYLTTYTYLLTCFLWYKYVQQSLFQCCEILQHSLDDCCLEYGTSYWLHCCTSLCHITHLRSVVTSEDLGLGGSCPLCPLFPAKQALSAKISTATETTYSKSLPAILKLQLSHSLCDLCNPSLSQYPVFSPTEAQC